jgi:carbon storage regulator
MLVISRKKDDKLVIGDAIEVSIVEIRGDKVRIGITCPADVPVHRQEVYEAIRHASSSWLTPAPAAPSPPVAAMAPATDVAAAPARMSASADSASVKLSGEDMARLDQLRQAGGLSREAALGTVLEVIDQAGITTLCDLERRLDR